MESEENKESKLTGPEEKITSIFPEGFFEELEKKEREQEELERLRKAKALESPEEKEEAYMQNVSDRLEEFNKNATIRSEVERLFPEKRESISPLFENSLNAIKLSLSLPHKTKYEQIVELKDELRNANKKLKTVENLLLVTVLNLTFDEFLDSDLEFVMPTELPENHELGPPSIELLSKLAEELNAREEENNKLSDGDQFFNKIESLYQYALVYIELLLGQDPKNIFWKLQYVICIEEYIESIKNLIDDIDPKFLKDSSSNHSTAAQSSLIFLLLNEHYGFWKEDLHKPLKDLIVFVNGRTERRVIEYVSRFRSEEEYGYIQKMKRGNIEDYNAVLPFFEAMGHDEIIMKIKDRLKKFENLSDE